LFLYDQLSGRYALIRFLLTHEIHGGARWVECNYGYGTFVHCDSERSLISSNAQDGIRRY